MSENLSQLPDSADAPPNDQAQGEGMRPLDAQQFGEWLWDIIVRFVVWYYELRNHQVQDTLYQAVAVFTPLEIKIATGRDDGELLASDIRRIVQEAKQKKVDEAMRLRRAGRGKTPKQ